MKRPKDKLWMVVAKTAINTVPKIVGLPGQLINLPITLAIDFLGTAPRGFGVPRLITEAAGFAVFAVAAVGTCDLALEIGEKFVCGRDCQICNGWDALQCTECKGTGRVMYRVKNYTLRRGEKATAKSIADAITGNRAELEHYPAVLDLGIPLPYKDCPTCDGSGVMRCPGCKGKPPLRISADKIVEPPLPARTIMKKMKNPNEGIIDSMKDPRIARFWLITMPQILGGFEFDDDVKKKLRWQYQESMLYDMRYYRRRRVLADGKPGSEHLQEALISIDPVRAQTDPVINKNSPYYKEKSALERKVMELKPPERPQDWEHRKLQEMDLPLNESSWSEVDLKDPKKLNEMKVLLDAQKEIVDKILDSQWEKEWRENQMSNMLEKKVKPYLRRALPKAIATKPIEKRRRWWWFF